MRDERTYILRAAGATTALLVAMSGVPASECAAAPLDLSKLRWYCQHAIPTNQVPYSNVQNPRGLAASVDGQYLYLGHNGPNQLPAVIKVLNDRTATKTNQFAANMLVRLYGYRGKAIATDDRGRVYLAEGDVTAGTNGVWWPVGGMPVTNAALPVAGINIFDSTLSNRLFTIVRTACEGLAVKREDGVLALYATDKSASKTLTRWELGENGGEITSAVQTGLGGGGEITNAGASSLRGLDVDAAGRIWMADVAGNRVWRCDHDGSNMTNVPLVKAFDVGCADVRAYVSLQGAADNGGSVCVLDAGTMAVVTNLLRPAASVTGVTNGVFACLDVLPGTTGIYMHVEATSDAKQPALTADPRWQEPVIHLTEKEAPVILSADFDSGTNFVLSWSSVAGEYYAVEATTNLLLGFQTDVWAQVQATPDVNICTVRVDDVVQQFFRIRVEDGSVTGLQILSESPPIALAIYSAPATSIENSSNSDVPDPGLDSARFKSRQLGPTALPAGNADEGRPASAAVVRDNTPGLASFGPGLGGIWESAIAIARSRIQAVRRTEAVRSETQPGAVTQP